MPAATRWAAAAGPRRSAPTTSSRTGSPTTASTSTSTSSTRSWPASSTRSSTRWSPTSAAASSRTRAAVSRGPGPTGLRPTRWPGAAARRGRAAPGRCGGGEPAGGCPAASSRRPRGSTGPSWRSGSTDPATVRGVAHFDAMLARRLAGEPLQYVLGSWGFRTLDLMVDRRVLIPVPRPRWWSATPWPSSTGCGQTTAGVDPAGGRPRDGSGAIALSLAAERDGRRGVGHRRLARRPRRGRRPTWPGSGAAGAAGAAGRGLVVRGPARRAARPRRPGGQQPAVRGRGRRAAGRGGGLGAGRGPGQRARPGPRRSSTWSSGPPTGWRAPAALVVELAPAPGRRRSRRRRDGPASPRSTSRADLAGRPRALVARLTDCVRPSVSLTV